MPESGARSVGQVLSAVRELKRILHCYIDFFKSKNKLWKDLAAEICFVLWDPKINFAAPHPSHLESQAVMKERIKRGFSDERLREIRCRDSGK